MPRKSSRKSFTVPTYTEVHDLPEARSPSTHLHTVETLNPADHIVSRIKAKTTSNEDMRSSARIEPPSTTRLASEIKLQVPLDNRLSHIEPHEENPTTKTTTTTPRRTRSKYTVEVEAGLLEADTVAIDFARSNAKLERIEAKDINNLRKESTGELPDRISSEAAVKKSRKRKADSENVEGPARTEKKVSTARKTKAEKEAEAMPFAPRTAIQGLKRAMYIGAHVSAAGGVQNAINNAIHIGGNSFALFLKSQRKWESPSLSNEAQDSFHILCKTHNYDAGKHVLPHGSYLVNLAQKEPEKAEQAYDCFIEDLRRCEALGIKLYNFHPGNTGGHPRADAIGRIATSLNRAHKATKNVVTLLENMAGAGNAIGNSFEDLRDIIALVQDKSRIGVCIDTCHAFAAGYDLRTPEAFLKTMNEFSIVVGMEYLKALHLNDSKAPFSSNRDLHANIGTGFLGLRAFHNVMNHEPFQNLPMVLETPIDRKREDGKIVEDRSIWAYEIKQLENMIGADADTQDFKAEEQRLQDVGASERERFQGQVDKKAQKTLEAMFKKAKSKGNGKKAKDEDLDAESEDGCSR